MSLLGVDLGGTNVRAAMVSEGRLLRVESQLVRSQGTAQEVFEDLCAVIDRVGVGEARGLGVGVPSLVDPSDGLIHDTTNIPAWGEVPLRAWLQERYALPIAIDNDANCFTLGERQYGAGRGCDNFVGLILGTGLGAGIITHGRLYSGAHCGAGEFGMIPYRDSNYEAYASGQFFRRAGTTGKAASQAAAAGDTAALALFEEYGRHLGAVVQVILYALAPQRIVLGGSVSLSFPYFRESLWRALDDFGFSVVVRDLDIRPSELENAALLGAAGLNA